MVKSYDFLFVGGDDNSYIFLTDFSVVYEIKFKNSNYLLNIDIEEVNNLTFEFVIDI